VRIECGCGVLSIARFHFRDIRNTGVIRRDGTNRQPGECRKLLGKSCGARLQVQPSELELGRRQLGLQSSLNGSTPARTFCSMATSRSASLPVAARGQLVVYGVNSM